jgi:hypothetical protein
MFGAIEDQHGAKYQDREGNAHLIKEKQKLENGATFLKVSNYALS